MVTGERVVENLNRALGAALAADPRLYLLGEDITDPYGGAFGATRGLSTRHPDRVLSTPLSEGAIVGVASGLALTGGAAIVEIMFSDFVTLAFDQIVNFASKSTTMYGRPVQVRLVIRCPTGGGRGYGPTHSQSLQKHFIGVPGLSLFEISAFHDTCRLLPLLLGAGGPCLLFEDKVLYTTRRYRDGVVDELFRYDLVGPSPGVARVRLAGSLGTAAGPDCVLIAPGGVAPRALAAMRSLLLAAEYICELLVPAQLYPFDVAALLPCLAGTGLVCVVEESTAGGTWGAELAHAIHTALWGQLRRPVRLIHSTDAVIPAAAHLEREVIVQDTTIHAAIMEALR